MGKWTRRGFITAGVVGGSALVIGIVLHCVPDTVRHRLRNMSLKTANFWLMPG